MASVRKYAGFDAQVYRMEKFGDVLDRFRTYGTFGTLHIGNSIDGEAVQRFLDACPDIAKRIEVEGGHPSLCSMDGMLYALGGKELLFCPRVRGGDIAIPEGVEWVSANAMCGMEIGRLEIPSSFTGIDDAANRMRFGQCNTSPFEA